MSPRERLKGKVKTVAALAAKGLEGHRTSLEKESLLDTCEAVRALSKKAFAALIQDVGKYFADIYKSLNLKGVAIGSEDFDARWLLSNLALAVILEGYACLPSYEKMEEKKSFTCLLCPEVSNPCGDAGWVSSRGSTSK